MRSSSHLFRCIPLSQVQVLAFGLRSNVEFEPRRNAYPFHNSLLAAELVMARLY